MNHKTLTRITQLTCSLIFASLSLEGFFTPLAQAQGAKPVDLLAEAALSSAPLMKTNNQMSGENNPVTIEETELGITLELVSPEYTVQNISSSDGGCQLFQSAGFGDAAQPGWPRLPAKGVMLNIPENAEPALDILEVESEILPGEFDICPAARPQIQLNPDGEIVSGGEEAVRDPEAYNQGDFFPAAAAELSGTAFIRDQRIAQLQFQPFQYNPQTHQVRFFNRIRVRVDYGAVDPDSAQPRTSGQAGGFDRILQDTLENFQTPQDSPAAGFAMSAGEAAAASSQQVKLLVDRDGMYAVSYEALAASGADLSTLTSASLQVFNKGSEIPLDVADGQDGSFDPGDSFFFYGQAVDTRYSASNVYWLTWGAGAGQRMATVSAASGGGKSSAGFWASQVMETNNLYLSSIYDNRGDHWFWELVSASGTPVSWSHDFNLPNVDVSAAGQAVLHGSLRSYYGTPRNHTRFYLNENFIG
jgi:hypothetical protein